MDHARRRMFISAVVSLLVIVVLGRAASLPHAAGAAAAININSDGNAAWVPTSPVLNPPVSVGVTNPNPPRLYAGDISHPFPADAGSIDNEPTNGYCVNISSSGLLPALVAGDGSTIPATDLGFRLLASDPINPTAPPTVIVPIPQSVAGAHDGVARFKPVHQNQIDPTAQTRKTVPGDAFCVIAQSLPGYRKLEISWNYVPDGSSQTDSTAVNVLELAPTNHFDAQNNVVTDSVASPDNTVAPFFGMQVKTVTLTASGPNAGGAGVVGTVCTIGWDASFLTGHTSNFPNTNNPGTPDSLNVVVAADFQITAVSGPLPTAVPGTSQAPNPYQQGTEWCLNIQTTLNSPATASVQFNFDAVYNIHIDTDDVVHSAATPPGAPLILTGNFAITNVSAAGTTLPDATSPQYVIGAPATACISGTVAGTDVLQANGLNFSSAPGPDVAHPAAVQVGTAGSFGITGQNSSTICVRFTSFTPGELLLSVSFTHSGAPVTAGWQHTDAVTGTQGGPLLIDFNRIDSTVITTGLDPTTNIVTGTTLNQSLAFNAADGTYIGGTKLTEWVLGSHNSGGRVVSGPVDGASLRATVTGTCGYFTVPDVSKPKVITGVSVGGRLELNDGGTNPLTPAFGDTDAIPDDLPLSVLHDGGCVGNSSTGISVDVFYPGQTTIAAPTETVGINFSFFAPLKTPRLAWIGDTVTLTYAFATGSSGCANASNTIDFIRAANQPGTFLPGPGITILGPDHAQSTFTGCTATVNYQSVDPGEVDVEAFIVQGSGTPPINTNISKVAYPIFYMALEDSVTTTTPTSVVSTEGLLSTVVRGWFMNDQPSSRPAVTTPDGRHLPAGRWVMPDDWATLQGPGGFRGNWGSPQMPATNVTYFMENEPILNGWTSQVKNGSSGWFVPNDASDYSFNINPITGQPSVLGSPTMPRIMSSVTDLNGNASVATFGDFNLSYEACAVNQLTQNPLCKPGDIVGHSRYYAIVDYRNDAGKYPPIKSETVQTDWTWAGYKQVTIEPGPVPSEKYVVVHLRDRDGFCNAIGFNNLLGIPVSFDIDSGSGIFLSGNGQPSSLAPRQRSDVVTSFDTQNDAGVLMHTDIAQKTIAPDECQAWVLVSNSLLTTTNVIVTIPQTPAPPPGNIRITGISCTAPETITLTNEGTNTVSLEGFALKSLPSNPIDPEEHLGLTGILAPGQSITFNGGPAAAAYGWLNNSSGLIFDQGASDYARLVWNGFQESYKGCDGTTINPPIPAALPSSGEGQTQFDVLVQFAGDTPTPLTVGWNLVTAGQGVTDLASVLNGHEAQVAGVYHWDDATSTWQRFILGTPGFVNTLTTMEGGKAYWVQVKQPFTLPIAK